MRSGVFALAVAAFGCAGTWPAESVARTFRPELFFAGRTHSSGTLVDDSGKPAGRFTGTTVGRRQPDGSTVFDQTIRMDDGTVRRRSFRLVPTGPDTIDVTGSEVVGIAQGTIRGDTFRLVSLIQSEPDNPFSTVQFDQTFTLRPDGRSVANQSEISVLGFVVRRADEVFTRTGPAR